MAPEGWNGFADSQAGTSLVHHEHIGIGYRRQATLGLHYMQAWSQDERSSQFLVPDGTITQTQADAVGTALPRMAALIVAAEEPGL